MTNKVQNLSPFLDLERKNEHKTNNFVHTVMLLVSLGLLMLVCAWLLAGFTGILLALITTPALFFLAPRLSGKMAMRMYRATLVDDRHGADLNRLVDILSDRAELPTQPKLYIIPSSTLNAFATGSLNAPYIAVTEGLLRNLDLREIAGVLAHEISHIRNDDLTTMALADTMSRITQLMSAIGIILFLLNFPLLFIGADPFPWLGVILLYLAPTAGNLIQLALSRTREFDADLEGASLTGDPDGLALALHKLERYQGALWEDILLPGRRIPQPSVLRSHPPTHERIAKLRGLKPALPPISIPTRPMITMVGIGPATLHPKYHFPWPGIWY